MSVLWFVSPFLFQSTLPHGERPSQFQISPGSLAFQSTLPHGERPVTEKYFASSNLFQSTLPHGERRGIYVTV